MSDTRITTYAEALIGIARAEGALDRVEDELFALGQAVESDDQLRSTLTDSRLPPSAHPGRRGRARRQGQPGHHGHLPR